MSQCIYHPDQQAVKHCSHCQASLCQACFVPGRERVLCYRCEAVQAGAASAREVAEGVAENAELIAERDRADGRSRQIMIAVQVCIILAALVVIVVQSQQITDAFQPEKPVRIGTYQTDASADRCLEILWQAAKILQEGGRPGPGMVCPGSDKSLLVIEKKGDVEAQVANPGRFGFRAMQVSQKHPVPELIK